MGLSAVYVDRVGALRGIFDIKSDSVTFVQFRELDSDQRFAVEKEVLGFSFAGDKAETLVREQFLDCTVHWFSKFTCLDAK